MGALIWDSDPQLTTYDDVTGAGDAGLEVE